MEGGDVSSQDWTLLLIWLHGAALGFWCAWQIFKRRD